MRFAWMPIRLLSTEVMFRRCVHGVLVTSEVLKRLRANKCNRSPLKQADWFGFPGPHEEIDYSAKLKFSDDEGDEEGEEEPTKSSSESRYEQTFEFDTSPVEILSALCETKACCALDPSEPQASQDAPPAGSRSRASDGSEETRHPPSSHTDKDPQPPSSKPGWAEEGGSGWQGGPPNYQVHILKCRAKHPQPGEGRVQVFKSSRAHPGHSVFLSVMVDCVCLYIGAQAWIGWSSGAALPPTSAAPWTRALLLFSTGRSLVVGS